MNSLDVTATKYIQAAHWAQEREKYANTYVIGKRWRLGDGDLEAVRIMQQAQNDEKVAFYEMEKKVKLVPLEKLNGVSSRTVTRQVRSYEFFAVKLARWLVFVEDDGPLPRERQVRLAM